MDKFTEGNAESTLKQIKAMVDPEKPYIKLSDELPNQDVTVDDIKTEEYSEDTASDYVPDEELEYSKSDLEQTNDTVLNDEIRTQFAELKTPIQIYEYIRNNVQPEFYYGSRKGAIGAFDQKAGNDYDIASLLIGVLRDKGTPARYVRGDIEITADQAMKWTATKNINVAVRQLVALGIPTTALLQNGEVVAVRMEHVWVEAYVPYTDYRGSGSQTGDKLWIPLDPSFKKSEYKPGIDWSQVKYYMENESNDISNMTDFVGVDMSEMSAFIGGENSAAMKYLIENGYADATKEEVFGGRAIISEKQKYLPLSLPYQVSTKKDSFADIPEDVTDSITVSLHGNSAFGTNFSGSDYFNKKIYTPDVYGKRITINYAPATEADKEVLNEYGGLFKTPAYLLKLRPQLLVDGEVVAEGTACSAGYQQQYEIKIHNGSKLTNDSNVSNKITAGGIYCIALDYGKIGAGEMQGIAGDLDKIKDSLSAENIYTDDAMGEMLNGVAKSYFAQLDMYNEVIAGQKSVTAYRNLTLGIVGFNVNVKYTFQQPTELNEGGIFLDIAHDAHCAISNVGNKQSEKEFMLLSGTFSSMMEHRILEQVTGVESVSTIKVFEYAQKNNIPLHTIVKQNLDEELSKITVSKNTKQEIVSAVNSGKMIIIPETEVTINQWSGAGYMVLDPETYACGYMIAGGLAGGSMTWDMMLDEYVEYLKDGLIYLITYEVVKALTLSLLPFGWVGTIFAVYEIALLTVFVTNIISLLIMYAATGEIYYLQEALVELAAMITMVCVVSFVKPKLEKMKSNLSDLIQKAKANSKNQPAGEQYPQEPGGCFVAGTLVATASGNIPIETVKAGDKVLSFNPDTQEVTEKTVEETFIRSTKEFVHITVGNDVITTTPEHPFYVMKKGFVNAADLRAGDILCTVNGDCVIVEMVQHEILETPAAVYNFRVETNHTYFVGQEGVGVHNAPCVEPAKPEPKPEPGSEPKPEGKNPKNVPDSKSPAKKGDPDPAVKQRLEQAREQLQNQKYNKVGKNGYKQGNTAYAKGEVTKSDGAKLDLDLQSHSKVGNAKVGAEGDGVPVKDANGNNTIVNKDPNFVSQVEKPKYENSVKKVDDFFRHNDTECKLIENLNKIVDGDIAAKGEIEIGSELPVCESCRSVIEAFSKDYPGIKIKVTDSYGYTYTIQGGVVQ